MGSEQNDGTSYQPSELKLCANNCGFFGNAATMNLCSKCYRDCCMKEEQAASVKVAVEKSFNPTPAQPDNHKAVLLSGSSADSLLVLGTTSSTSPLTSLVSGDGDREAQPPKVAGRCLTCNKKVGLTGFRCKCENTFCGFHRYPEKHDCTFDFKAMGRDAIAKANPLVKADKVDRF